MTARRAVRHEYRVTWKRVGCDAKVRRYSTLAGAERFLRLFGPEPWTYKTGATADALWCCYGYECSCGGVTNAEAAKLKRCELPELEYARIERRRIGEWEAVA
jgi:hypothetical protein